MVAAMRLPVYIFIAAFAVIVGGCTGAARRADAALSRADSLIAVSPDSALAVLNDVSPTGIGRRRQARLSLLRAKAKSKCYLPLREDSAAIADAAQFYRLHGDSLAVQSQFYLGELLAESGYDSRALVPLHNAYDLAKETGDYFYAGMSARALGVVYNNLKMTEKALEWSLSAYDNFQKAKAYIHAEWMKDLIAHNYIYTGNPQKGLEILENVDFKGSDFLHCSVVRERANAFRQMGDFESAIGELKVLQNIRGNLSSHEWSKMGRYLCEIKDYRNAAVALDSAKLYAETRNDSLFVKYVTALILIGTHHFQEGSEAALDWGQSMMDMYDEEISNPPTVLLTDYLNIRVKEQEREVREMQISNRWLLVLGVLLLIIAILVQWIQRNRLKYAKINLDISFEKISKLSEDLEENRELTQSLILKDKNSFERISGIMNGLSTVNFSDSDSVPFSRKLKKEISTVIDYFRSEDTIAGLEDSINLHHDGWMRKLREMCPDLSAAEYRLAIYLYIGLSPESIAVLTGKTTLNAVYLSKTRLGKKISSCDGIYMDEICNGIHIRR